MRSAMLATLLVGVGLAGPGRAVEEPLEGSWTLVVLTYGSDEFLIVEARSGIAGQDLGAVASQPFLGAVKVERLERRDGTFHLALNTASGPATFTGKAADGAEPRPILGTFRFRDEFHPARLEPTESRTLAALSIGPLNREVSILRRIEDPKEQYQKLGELLAREAGNPANAIVYGRMLQTAEAAGRTPEDVQALLDQWQRDAEPYGEAWRNEVRLKAIRALADQKTYAGLVVDLARRAEREMGPEATVAQHAAVAEELARAARIAGDHALAQEATKRSNALQAELDEEYRQKVPPFEPQAFAGRTEPESDRVVLLELFTGAQCPPCVAADVAFDAMLESYRPGELIGLQYHLHIPGPDPLTNPGSLARAEYYGVSSTPSTIFNGEAAGRGGGTMAMSEAKYAEYREIVEKRLAGSRRASIELDAHRQGDGIAIQVSATAEGVDPKAEDAPKLRLRLALVEESIRFVGGNKLRFHHHVVRSLPGGPDGFAFADGSCRQELTVPLGDVRQEIESYLSDYSRTRGFPQPAPPIDLKGLSVVAFVQDDADRSIWHAVLAKLDEPEKP